MSGVPEALAARGGVALAELVERAALLTRVDRKYVVPTDRAARLVADLPPEVRVLEIGGVRLARYESVYFDTPELVSYLTTAHRRRRRFKIRTRTYLDTGDTYLEVKTRGVRGLTVKERRPCPASARSRLAAADGEYAARVLVDAAVPPVDTARLAPTLEVTYRRATLLLPGPGGASARATIDLDLRWAVPGSASDGIDVPDLAVVETKSAGHPGELDRLLWARGYRPVSVSKYGTGLAALHPGLPANRWHRTITRDVGPRHLTTHHALDRDPCPTF